MDYALDIIVVLFVLYLCYGFWFEYFAKCNKLSDEQVINGYFLLTRKRKQK